MSPAQPWLPVSAILDDQLRGMAKTIVGQWSEAWIAAAGAKVSVDGDPGFAGRAGSISRRDTAPGESVVIDAPNAVREALVAAALGGHPPGGAKSGIDAEILVAFEVALLGDLAGRFRAAFDKPESDAEVYPVSPPQRVRIPLALQSHRFCIDVDGGLAIRWRRAQAAPAVRDRVPMADRVAALEDMPIAVAVSLGSARLNLNQLRSLEAGDVLVLDRRTADGAALCAARRHVAIAAAAIIDRGAGLSLQIKD